MNTAMKALGRRDGQLPYRGAVLLSAAGLVFGGCNISADEQVTVPEVDTLPLVLDGDFSEWDDSRLGVEDPSGDGAAQGVDFGTVQIANDRDYLYLTVDLGIEVALNEERTFTIYIDTDGDPSTGIKVEDLGVELTWDVGRQEGVHWVDGERKNVQTRNLNFRAAPTVDAQRFEIALSLSAEPSEGNPIFIGKPMDIVLRDTSRSDGDRVPDTGAVRFAVDPAAATVEPISFERGSGVDIRIISYNVERPGFEDDAVHDEFERIFQAVQPDIILLQEQDYAGLARTLIGQWLPPGNGTWYMDSLTDKVTLSRLPFREDWPTSRGQLNERILPNLVDLGEGRSIALFNAHLSCCEDEIARQREADSFVSFLREQRFDEGTLDANTPFLMAGDLNLVMKQQPLNTLMGGEIVYTAFGDSMAPDWDGTWLSDALPRHSHQGMSYTWRSDYSYYWPGRLDFGLYTDSVMTLEKAFVIDTESMDSATLEREGLLKKDTKNASDHLPIVFDFSLQR